MGKEVFVQYVKLKARCAKWRFYLKRNLMIHVFTDDLEERFLQSQRIAVVMITNTTFCM